MVHRTASALFLIVFCVAAAPSPTHFTRDAARFKAMQQALIAKAATRDAQTSAALQQLFAQDIIAMLDPDFRAMGLDNSDVADMTAVYWINVWEAANGIFGHKTDLALVRGARTQLAGTITNSPGFAQMNDAQKQEIADSMILQAVLIAARSGGRQDAATRQKLSDAIAQEAQQVLKVDMRAVALTPAGFRPKAGMSGTAPVSRQPVADAPAALVGGTGSHPENWKNVEGVYFKSTFIVGAGGMMVQDFQPVVLFRDGSYYEVEGQALEDIDLAASRATKLRRWGRWQKSGDAFSLTDDKGRPGEARKLQDGWFFKAFPAEGSGNKLANRYTRVSGGGNTALGGTVMVMSQTDLTFLPDGRFMRKGSGGGSNSGGWTGVGVSAYSNNANAGQYKINQYTISMTQPDGSTKRQFFAFGSQKSPARIDADMMFIGDTVYTVMHSR